MEEIIRQRAQTAWNEAFAQPRWCFQHKTGPCVPLTPVASAAIDAGATVVPLGYGDGIFGHVLSGASELEVDGNVHTLHRVAKITPEDVELSVGTVSLHVDVDAFLTEVYVATNIAPSRINVYMSASGLISVEVAPSEAWVDPLIRRCLTDATCIQQFVNKYMIGGVDKDMMRRVLGSSHLAQCAGGTPNALLPFVSRVKVFLDDNAVVDAYYHHTITELLAALPAHPVYLHGIHLVHDNLPLWILSPVAHGAIYLYSRPANHLQRRLTMGGPIMLPTFYSKTAFVPCRHSFTGNAFAPALRNTPESLASMAPAHPTCIFMQAICIGEPMTLSRAQCIYRHMKGIYCPKMLRKTLLSMALPRQAHAMDHFLASKRTLPAHPTFDRYVSQLAACLTKTM